MSGLTLALIVESWWGACCAFRWARMVFLLTAFHAAVVWPNLVHLLWALALAILSHVGYRGTATLLIETARRSR